MKNGKGVAYMAGKCPNEKLRELRGKRKREEVARAIGITPRALQSYELGDRVPSDDVKIRLANYYKRSVQYIFFN